jgi:hypothetical protein
MLSGAFAGVLTALFATWLPLVFPFLRRRSRRHLHRGGEQQQPPARPNQNRNRRGGAPLPQQPQPQKGATPAGPAVPPAVAAKPKPRPRHVASALTWSSDEEEGVPGPLVPPPTLFHKGLTAKGKAAAAAAGGSSSSAVAGSSSSAAVAGPSTWSRGSGRHRAQQPGKVKVRVGDTIHEESSLSDDQWAAGGSKGKR